MHGQPLKIRQPRDYVRPPGVAPSKSWHIPGVISTQVHFTLL
jgi:hypothetical protein